MKTLSLCLSCLFILSIPLNATIELSCSEDIEIQDNADDMMILIWSPPIVETDCTDGFQLQQVRGPEFGSEVFIGEYYVEFEAFEVCNPGNIITCGFVISGTSDRPQDQFIQLAFPEELNSVSEVVDINSDGLLDVVGSLNNGNLVWYENESDNNWTPHLISTEHSNPRVVDIDGDGDQDYVVVYLIDSSHDGLGILINDNNESYTFHVIYDEIASGFGSLFQRSNFGVSDFVDVDNDGLLDIQFRTEFESSNDCSACWEGRHLVAFQTTNSDFSVVSVAGRDFFRFTDIGNLQSGDFDADGDLDFAIAYFDPEDEIRLIRNNGGRSFGSYPNAAIDATERVLRLVVNDLDEDGDLDIYGSPVGDNNLRHYFSNDGTGDFARLPMPNGVSLPGPPNFDYDNDGRVDLVTGSTWHENLSNFDFFEHAISDELTNHTILDYVDMDGDGDTDLFVRHIDEGDQIYFWENQRIGGEEEVVLEITCPDENLELVGNDENMVTLTWSLPEVVSTCSEGFEIIQTSGPEQEEEVLIGSYTVEYEIFDNCNPTEITFCSIDINAISSRAQDPFIQFQFPFEDEVSSIVEVIDYDNDGLKDLIATIEGQGTYWYKNEGNNNWTKTMLTTESLVERAIDIDDDGDIDLIYVFPYSENLIFENEGLGILENDGNNQFTDYVLFEEIISFGGTPFRRSNLTINGIGDFDNDGHLDILMDVTFNDSQSCSECSRNFMYVLYSNGNFDFERVSVGISDVEPGFVAIFTDSGDIDGDGDLDLLQGWANPEERIWYRINDGNREFSFRSLPEISEVNIGRSPVLFDIDNDGDLDVYEVDFNDETYYYENNGVGDFTAVQNPEGKSMPRKPNLDYNGDDNLDYISNGLQTWSEYLGTFCYFNHEISSDLNTSDHQIISATDMDDDGDIDLWVRNISTGQLVYWENKRIDEEETVVLEITCPEDVLLSTAGASVFVELELPTILSDCSDGYSIDTLGDLFPDQMYPPGLYSVEYVVTDNCNSEPRTCSFDIAVEQIQGGDCPNELPGHTFLGEIDEHKYFLSDVKLNWNDAALAAAKIGANIATIEDDFENEFIFSRLSELAYIGYNDANSEGDFVWQNGQISTFENLSSQNSDYADFAFINFWDGQWGLSGPFAERKYVVEIECGNTFDCRLEIPIAEVNCFDNGTSDVDDDGFFIDAQVDAFGLRTSQWVLIFNGETFTGNYGESISLGPFLLSDFNGNATLLFEDQEFDCFSEISLVLPDACSGMDLCPEEIESFSNFGSFGNSTYYLSSIAATWQEANLICQENGGYLVSVETEAENDFVENVISEIIHIGLNDESAEGTFLWSDGSSAGYTNFSDCIFCPTNSATNDFGSMNFWDGTWNVDGPFAERRFLMELQCNPAENSGIMPRLAFQGNTEFERILVSPNPTNGITNVNLFSKLEKNVAVKIYDAQGIERMQLSVALQDGSNQFDIDLSSYAAGLYFLRIENQTVKIFKK